MELASWNQRQSLFNSKTNIWGTEHQSLQVASHSVSFMGPGPSHLLILSILVFLLFCHTLWPQLIKDDSFYSFYHWSTNQSGYRTSQLHFFKLYALASTQCPNNVFTRSCVLIKFTTIWYLNLHLFKKLSHFPSWWVRLESPWAFWGAT